MCVVVRRGMGWSRGVSPTYKLRYIASALSSAYLHIFLFVCLPINLSVALSNWSTAWRERQRSCRRSAGIRDAWHVQCWETYRSTQDEDYAVCGNKTKSLHPCLGLCEAALSNSGALNYMLTSACEHAHNNMQIFSRYNVYYLNLECLNNYS